MEDEPTDVPLPVNPKECEGFCIGAPKSGGNLEMTPENCKISSFQKDPNNSYLCPSPDSAKEGCKLLIKQLNKEQEGKGKEDDKGWSFNLCGPCKCDWGKGKWFKPADGDLMLTFDKTWVGQHIDLGFLGTVKCRYQITGSITVKVKKGSINLAPCKE